MKTYDQLKEEARAHVIRYKTRSHSIFDGDFMIHAQGAICWMAEFAYLQQQILKENGTSSSSDPTPGEPT